ncbi:MAG: hypothetical protein ABIH63_04630 [archaeon]
MAKDFTKKILVGLTGWKKKHWQEQLEEINKHNIRKIALFLEMFKPEQRKKIYEALLKSKAKEIPLVHLRNDMNIKEIKFLIKKFKTKYFTIHENTFRVMRKWNGNNKKLYLEMNVDNRVPKNVKINRIGGFCVDLSHYMVEKKLNSREYDYIEERRKVKKYFRCNHINGYSYKKNKDLHTVKSLREFEYIKKLPNYLFGEVIGIEVFNSIKEQLKFKEHLIKLLNKKFNK